MVSQRTPLGQSVASGQVCAGSAQGGVNVGDTERWLSVVGGGLLAVSGLRRGDLTGLCLSAIGGSLLYRGITGHCQGYSLLGVNTAEHHSRVASVRAGAGIKIEQVVTINRSAAELYHVWRDFNRLPQFMSHLVSVQSDGKRSHWVAKAPAGFSVAWDAEIVNDIPNRLIAWRSLVGSTITTAGSVSFTPAPAGRGTEVRVTLKYDPPAGRLGSWLSWCFGEEPGQQIQNDLHRFQQLMETGEFATTAGMA